MSEAVADGVLGELRGLGLTPDVRDQELPQVRTVGPQRKPPTRKALLGGLFCVFGGEIRLKPPIDWLADPHGSRSWRYELHTLTWLNEALARHARGGDVESLAVARNIAVDWAHAHLRASAEQSEFAWYDMAVGLRAPYLAYVLRAGLVEEILDDADAGLLLEAVERHGAELTKGRNYAAAGNHGLFQDEGLYLLARFLPSLPVAEAWRELALSRMRATLEVTVSFEDGAHLEHSPAYQFAIVDLLARLATDPGELPTFQALRERMCRTAAWQTTPRGRMAQLGDTDDLPAPPWARDTASRLEGVHFLSAAGQAFVRHGDSYLAVTAGYHGTMHKHADDGGFLLIEGGRVVLGDAGRWGYYEDEADRLYARSAAAHNVLTVDGGDFDWREAEPYGSALEAVGEADGWYAIGLGNPLLGGQGVTHKRLLCYQPGRALVIFDQTRSQRQRHYLRHFHFGPDLQVRSEGGDTLTIQGDGIAATLTELSGGTEIDLNRGMEDAPHLGWTYPGDRERTEVWTARLRSSGEDMDFTTAISLDGEPIEPLPDKIRRLL